MCMAGAVSVSVAVPTWLLQLLPMPLRMFVRLVVPQALDKARKDMEKARKVREPLRKALAEDPATLTSLAAEVEQLQQQLAAL